VTLALEQISYRYAGATEPSLRDVSLELRDGEVLGLVGASESGKSTLCLVSSGLAPRTIGGRLSGRVLLDGADIEARPIHELAGQIGIAFQNPATQRSEVTETVFEEVAFGPMNLGRPLDEILQRTWSALRSLRIEDLAPRDPGQLSGGQQQLVAIAGLLAMGPSHLVLDEPTAQLDPAGTTLVGDAIAQLAQEGASILLVEHKTDLVARICSRVIALEAGRVAIEGEAGEVLSDPRLRRLGVAEPSSIRLRRLAREAGVDPSRLEGLEASV
jgi:energy-coupling factor transport system ATP-binding protein